jgi:RNA polymerase sigma-70 factor (ECF subfamily)
MRASWEISNMTDSLIDLQDDAFLQDLRKQMLRFTVAQLSDSHLADDVVQEALMGALKGTQSFRGQAAIKTWVFAILKNKIADALRQKHRHEQARVLLQEDEELEDFSDAFKPNGHWQSEARPASWGNPQDSLDQAQFWTVFEYCLDHLPNQQGRAFMMREFVELSTQEICQELGITLTNLNVLLHRARMRLRECLNIKWFELEATQ